jgi:predicted DNA-binding transcriptional regulator AlpA
VYDLDTIARVSRSSTTLGAVKVDVADLLNATEVAAVLGLAHREAVATYRRRYSDFPEPVIVKGTCVLWRRVDVDRWAERTGRS